MIQGANDALRINSNFASGTLLIDNSGTIRSATGQGLDLDAIRSNNVTTTIINRAGGLIRGDASDGMKTGANATITNYGEISTGDTFSRDDKFDGVDIDSATGVTVTNYGLISGGRHGITTDLGASLTNYGTVINHGADSVPANLDTFPRRQHAIRGAKPIVILALGRIRGVVEAGPVHEGIHSLEMGGLFLRDDELGDLDLLANELFRPRACCNNNS